MLQNSGLMENTHKLQNIVFHSFGRGIWVVLWYLSTLCVAQPRSEYPRPQFERAQWQNINGTWTYTFDFSGTGEQRGWTTSSGFDGKIVLKVNFRELNTPTSFPASGISVVSPSLPNGKANAYSCTLEPPITRLRYLLKADSFRFTMAQVLHSHSTSPTLSVLAKRLTLSCVFAMTCVLVGNQAVSRANG